MKNGRSWAEVDLSCIVNNYNIYKRFAGKNVMAVVKANAYGHGSVAVAKALQASGVELFAVAAINEAIEHIGSRFCRNDLLWHDVDSC